MRILFDQGTHVPIRRFLKEHTVQTTAQRGWEELKNGELLKAAEEAGFVEQPDSAGRHDLAKVVSPAVWLSTRRIVASDAFHNGLWTLADPR